MPRIVFAADSHLNKHYGRMTPDQLASRRARLRAAMGQTVDYAIEVRANIYIHGGDLFDGPNPRAVEIAWVAEQLQRLADSGVRTMLIGGNHDIPKTRHHGAAPQRVFDAVRLSHTFTLPTAVEWVVERADGARVAVGGLPPDPRLSLDDDPLLMLERPIEPPECDVALLVTHYAVEGLLHPLAEEPTIARSSIAALAGVVDCVLVGHVHEGQELSVGGVKVLLPGPTERMSFGEIDVRCGFALLEIEDRQPFAVTSRHVELEPQPMRREVVRAIDIPAEGATEWLCGVVRDASAPDQILQLRLEGQMDRDTYQALRLIDVWHVGNEGNFYFDLDRHRLTVYAGPDVELPRISDEAISPRAEIARVADGMIDLTDNEDERELLAEARDLVLSQYVGGSIVDDDRPAGHSADRDGAGTHVDDGERT